MRESVCVGVERNGVRKWKRDREGGVQKYDIQGDRQY